LVIPTHSEKSHRYDCIEQEEIPYNCEVVIEQFQDKSDNFSAIEVSIMVSQNSQKIILIGKNGSKIKELGILSRGKLEKV